MDEHLLRFDKDKIYTFIDCETENLCLNDFQNLPWQIGMIQTKGEKRTGERDLWIQWDRDINMSADAARITKFNREKYDSLKRPYDEVFEEMRSWVDNCDYIVGHNVLGFDVYLINNFYKKMGLSYQHIAPKMIDTNCLAKGVKFGLRLAPKESLLSYQYRLLHKRKRGVRTSLIALGKEYEIDFDPTKLHEALYDLELNIKVWDKLKWMTEV
jgi:DNA polymerase III epsilon subunit-like protein